MYLSLYSPRAAQVPPQLQMITEENSSACFLLMSAKPFSEIETERMSSSATVMHRDEAERVKALLDYEILDTLPDPAFDEIARMAASISGAPYAFIGLVDWSRVWFKSRIGFSDRQIARTRSACQFVVLDGRPALIGDTAGDHRFPAHGFELTKNIYLPFLCRGSADLTLGRSCRHAGRMFDRGACF